MARGRPTPPAQKAAATAHLLTGASAAEASATSGVALRTVERIKAEMAADGGGKQTSWDYAALVGAYLGECLQTLTRQVRVCGDPDWIAQQPARDLAIFHGVVADKVLAILAAWHPPAATPELPLLDATVEHTT